MFSASDCVSRRKSLKRDITTSFTGYVDITNDVNIKQRHFTLLLKGLISQTQLFFCFLRELNEPFLG